MSYCKNGINNDFSVKTFSFVFALILSLLMIDPQLLGNCPKNPRSWCQDIDATGLPQKAREFLDYMLGFQESKTSTYQDLRTHLLSKMQISNDIKVLEVKSHTKADYQVIPESIRQEYNIPAFLDQIYLRDFLSVIFIPIAPSLPFFFLSIQTAQMLAGWLLGRQRELMCEHARWCIEWKQKATPSCTNVAVDNLVGLKLQHDNSGQIYGDFKILPSEEVSLIVDHQAAIRLGVASLPSLPIVEYRQREYHFVWIESVTLGSLTTQHFVKVLFPISASSSQEFLVGVEFLRLFKTTLNQNNLQICDKIDTMPMFVKFTDLLPFTLPIAIWFLWIIYQSRPIFGWLLILLINAYFRAPWLFTQQAQQTVQDLTRNVNRVIQTQQQLRGI